ASVSCLRRANFCLRGAFAGGDFCNPIGLSAATISTPSHTESAFSLHPMKTNVVALHDGQLSGTASDACRHSIQTFLSFKVHLLWFAFSDSTFASKHPNRRALLLPDKVERKRYMT